MEFEYGTEKELKETLVDFIVPFVNAEPDDAVKMFVEFFASEAVIEKEKTGYFSENNVPMPLSVIERESAILKQHARFFIAKKKEIKEIHSIFKTMLVIAFRGLQGLSIEDVSNTQIIEIEKKISEAFEPRKPEAKWRGIGGNYVMFSPKEQKLDPLSIHIDYCINCIVRLFRLFPGDDGKIEIMGNGFSLVGLCPICGNFFKRQRKTKEFCSDKCASAARMRAYRDRKK